MARSSSRSATRRADSQRPSSSRQIPIGETVTTAFSSVRLEADRDSAHRITLFLDETPSSFIDLADPLNVGFEYLDTMFRVITTVLPDAGRILHLGAAGCSLARALHVALPTAHQIAVDYDAELLTLARKWFDLPRSPALRLRGGDALAELATMQPGSCDAIIRDIFAAGAIPHHVMDQTMVHTALDRLKPGGLYLINSADRQPLTLVRREVATLAWALTEFALEQDLGSFNPYDHLVLVAEPSILKKRRYGNVVLILHRPSEDHQENPVIEHPTMERQLRSMAVPATVVTGQALRSFVAGHQPFEPAGTGALHASNTPGS
ncbi:spermidine synthase [Jonesia quinghaiensis]|uniref:spermidine synthase n=1 Tax=Jonesia quinghaiensis TaxID=262806 RepID=UPI00040AFF10|nr:fused MFS/spermidine synthase [Jonesia quinghaiensis]